jgi:hypothetical protein
MLGEAGGPFPAYDLDILSPVTALVLPFRWTTTAATTGNRPKAALTFTPTLTLESLLLSAERLIGLFEAVDGKVDGGVRGEAVDGKVLVVVGKSARSRNVILLTTGGPVRRIGRSSV